MAGPAPTDLGKWVMAVLGVKGRGPSTAAAALENKHWVSLESLLTRLLCPHCYLGLEQCLLNRVSDHADQCHTGEGKSTSAVWSQQISVQPDESTAVLQVLGADPRKKRLVHTPKGRWLTQECHSLPPSPGTTGPITFECCIWISRCLCGSLPHFSWT